MFRVQRGKRFRFRFVNAASHVCPFQFQIENHKIQIIASDSIDFEPVVSDILVSTSGERYDFVLFANSSNDDHLIRITAIGPCEGKNIEQFAVLSYAPSTVTNLQLAFPSEPYPSFQNNFNEASVSIKSRSIKNYIISRIL